LFNEVNKRFPIYLRKRITFNQEFFLILNLAMGGTYAGEDIDPMLNQAQLYVDYIRYYSINGVGKVIKG
jgi:hypothetical protein